MAITTFSELQAAIANRMNRTDLTALIPEFIAGAEARMNRVIRAPQMIQAATLAIAGRLTPLPSDFLQVERVTRLDGGARRVMRFVPGPLEAEFGDGSSGVPNAFSIRGLQLECFAPPAGPTSVDLSYYARIPALSGPNPANWVLTSHPDIYLYGSLVEASIYRQDSQREADYASRVGAAMEELNGSTWAARAGDSMTMIAG